MSLFKLHKSSLFTALIILVAAFNSTESKIIIQLIQSPPSWANSSTAIFQYNVENMDGSNACRNNSCFIYCELDGKALAFCPLEMVVLRNLSENYKHNFLLNVTTSSGERNSSSYSWFIDTIPPTATLSSEQNYTSQENVAVNIKFSEACGFKCTNSSNCDVTVIGPAYIQASSLRVLEPRIEYSLKVIISSKVTYGRVLIKTADNVCSDQAGNRFIRTNASVMVIHFDRRPVMVDLWASVPSYELEINGALRTVFATNKVENLELYLDFSIPVMNSTEEILNALHVNAGSIVPLRDRTRGNRRFAFTFKNILETEIITINLHTDFLIGITGAPVSPVNSLTFLYDYSKPGVGISSSSPSVTKEPNINVIVEFTKPVFGFQDSMVEVNGGKLTRFKELSRALYSLTIQAITDNVVSVSIPAGKANDISGNLNIASNRIEIMHYTVPAISTALHSFVTAGILATSLAAAVLSLSSANLGAIASINTASENFVASNPSMNLHGMVGHMQVFVLSDWILSEPPIEYSETTRGLRWLIPRQKLPWKKNSSSVWPNHIGWFKGSTPSKKASHEINSIMYFNVPREPELLNLTDQFHGLNNMSKENTPYGLPLHPNEYFTYFLRGEPLSARGVVKKMENYKGWQDMEMNMFWLGIGGGVLLIVHTVMLVFLRWRTGKPAYGILSAPRFEILLLILALPCISQSSIFLIKGGTAKGIITGALLLTIPTAFILSVCLFLTIVIFTGTLAQYKEIRYVTAEVPWYRHIWFFFAGRPSNGKWFYIEGLPSTFLARFGILFEDQKGPPVYILMDQNDSNTIPRWTGSGQSGIGRMRAVSSDDSNEEAKIPPVARLLGCARSSYIVLDLVRRIFLGTLAGSFLSSRMSQSLCALTITLTQFVCLLILKPHIRRGVHLVEGLSLLCEAGVFSISLYMNKSKPVQEKHLGFILLGLLFITFVAQIINEWYAMMKCLLNLAQPQKTSFKLGLKCVVKGVLLPFIPKKHWPRVIPGSSQPKTGLAPGIPLSPDPQEPRVDQFSSMSATVVPVASPDKPFTQSGEGTREKGLKVESKREMKKLRELAMASFSPDRKGEECSTSYESHPSTSKIKY